MSRYGSGHYLWELLYLFPTDHSCRTLHDQTILKTPKVYRFYLEAFIVITTGRWTARKKIKLKLTFNVDFFGFVLFKFKKTIQKVVNKNNQKSS